MGLIIDIIAIAFVLISSIAAYKKGFVKTFFGFISVVLAVLVACCFSKPVANHLKASTEIDEWIIQSVTNIGESSENIDEKEYTILSGDNISGEIIIEKEDTAEEQNNIFDGEIVTFIENLPEVVGNVVDIEDVKNQTISNISVKVADVVISILAWIIIYFAVRIVVAVVAAIFDGIMSIPILKSINNLAGLIIGFVMGIFRIYLLLAIIYFISNIISTSFFINIIQTSSLINAMYNSNLIINLIF